MKHWRQTFGGLTIKLVSSCSVFLVLVAAALAVDYRALDDQLSHAKNSAEVLSILRSASPNLDQSAQDEITLLGEHPTDSEIDTVRWDMASRAMLGTAGSTEDATKVAKEIKSSPIYRDPGEKDSANWLGKAFDRLGNLFKSKPRSQSASEIPRLGGMGGGLGFLSVFVWILLGLVLAAFAYYAFRHVSFTKGLKRKRKAILEEDEPERTLDEWLTQADALAAKGQYREAVRALYLACLLKFDEHRVARFIRAETNWEHLARIKLSPTKPVGLEFTAPTQAFDQIWYGHRVNGMTDVERFRDWYSEVKRTLEAKI